MDLELIIYINLATNTSSKLAMRNTEKWIGGALIVTHSNVTIIIAHTISNFTETECN